MRERSDRPGSRSIRKAFGAFVSITVLSSIFLTSIPASGQEAPLEQPTIASDKADYAPGETVTLTGTGWTGDGNVRIEVDDDQGRNWYYTESVVVQPDGTITDTFTLPSHFIAVYYVTATGLDTARQATTSFTDMSIGLYDQCSNDDGDGYAAGDTGCRWTNGNLQSNNSTYSEGEATVQRLWLTDFEPGSTHTVTLKYGTTKSGKHAYDFLTTWDWSENWITEADRCQDITGCVGLGEDLLDIPLDPNVPDAYENFTRQFVMRGGDMTVATTPSIVSGTYAGDSETVITITFTVAGSGSMCVTKNDVTTCGVALWFGAHIARQADWGTGNGAGNIPGSPYHVALDAVDGAAVGQRDNQMQSATVVVNGTIIIAKDAIPNAAQDFSFNLTNGSTVNQNFSLDDDSDATLPSSQTFAVPPGTYTASELNIPSGWSLTDIVCVDPSTNSTWDIPAGTATIVLASAETVTCTFTDTKGAQLSIHKSTVGGNGTFDYEATGTGMPDDAAGPDFQITTSGGSGSYSGNPIAFAAGSFGTKTVTETVPTGWTLTNITCTGDTTGVLIGSDADFDAGDTSVDVPIDAGDSVSCTFENTKDATLTVIKDAIPDDPQDFSFTNTGFAPATDLLDDDGDETNTLKSSVTYTFSGSDFDAGAETVTEDGETGWALTDLDCTGDDDFSEAGSTATLDVEPGETIVCTFENTKLGSITIVKDAVPNDAQDFEFDPTASLQANNFFLDDDANATLSNQKVFGSLLPGTYGVDEVNIPSGWDLTDISCTGDTGGVTEGTTGVSIDLAAGENVTCTFENTKRGTIIVEKQTVPDGAPGDFVFTGDAAGTLQDGGQITVGNLVPGPYTSTEADPTGIFFQLSSITCDDQASTTPSSGVIEPNGAGGTATFNLDPGETVKCVFTNTKAIHPGTIGFWRNWRNHYNSTEFQYLIDYLKANNPSVYASLTITKYDAIFDFPKGLGRDQMILAQLTAVKSNLAISDEGACFGLEQKNDDIFLNGSLVDLSPIPGATDYFDTNNDDKVTIEEVVDVIEGHWTGSLQSSYPKKWNDGFSSFSPLTDDQIITVLTGINEGWLIMDSGDGPSNCP